MKVAHVVDLRQRQELLPAHAEWVLAQAADFEPPRVEWNGGAVAKIEHGPVRHLPLADRKLRHAVPVSGTTALGWTALERNVDTICTQLPLTLNVAQAFADEVLVVHHCT